MFGLPIQNKNSEIIMKVFSFIFLNHDLNRDCLVYMFSMHFSGSKFFDATYHSFPQIS